jgi:hypothetical protein
MIIETFLDFPDPNKSHRASTIGNFLTSFVNICLSHIFSMPKGIEYLLTLYVNKLWKPKPPSAEANEDRCSTTIFFVWFLYLLEFSPTPNLSTLGVVFSCQFLIRVLRYFRHEFPQVQTNLTR